MVRPVEGTEKKREIQTLLKIPGKLHLCNGKNNFRQKKTIFFEAYEIWSIKDLEILRFLKKKKKTILKLKKKQFGKKRQVWETLQLRINTAIFFFERRKIILQKIWRKYCLRSRNTGSKNPFGA